MILQNLGQKLLAFVSALALWVFLMSVQNAFYQLPKAIPLEPVNLNDLYTLKEALPGIEIKINTKPDKVQKISADDFTASLDLNGLGEGTHTVPVKVQTNLSDVTVLKIEPAEVVISLESSKEKELPIVLDIQGKPATGYEVGNSYPLESKLMVKGGSNLANAIQIKATLQLDGSETENVNKKVKLVIINNVGEEVENLKLPTEEMNVVVEIKKGKISKTLNVAATISEASKGKYQGKIQVVPSQIVVKGSEDLLKNLSSLITEEIKDEEIKEGAKLTKKVILPEGVELKENETGMVIINIF